MPCCCRCRIAIFFPWFSWRCCLRYQLPCHRCSRSRPRSERARLARHGVLPTSLLAVDEAAGIDILCADKTGTLTRNARAVMSVHAMPMSAGGPEFDEGHVLALAALASSDGGQDPVDAAVRAAAARSPVADGPTM